MENQNVKVTVEEGVKELVIREGKANDVHVPSAVIVQGATIGSVAEYLGKEGIDPDEIKNSKVQYSYEGLYLDLFYAARRENYDTVNGVLKLHPELLNWQINKGRVYEHKELADFINMNRHYFDDKGLALKLVAALRNIKVKAQKALEAADDKRGSARVLVSQEVIESNIPAEFYLNLPVFVGQDPERIKIEIEVDADTYGCALISPELKEFIDVQAKEIIGAQLDKIAELYPQLKIFQL
ncbi:MAG: hypothetical protein BM557_09620 [Flavobacterium sp. MedPE-SWcel]|uniref:hypothetical protein n=1 Tax=uncultured Flavobacterium sp. TaxID=165435 RepID=UPI00091BA6F0|nr:hypothetical protein [uncultured Flavobacterium sp.]OIQ16562.1 MAG: hypothetical protein BM557_09620 [Flavobacterium sp. MedPE-SWcel]